jgi:hypothetical protein
MLQSIWVGVVSAFLIESPLAQDSRMLGQNSKKYWFALITKIRVSIYFLLCYHHRIGHSNAEA